MDSRKPSKRTRLLDLLAERRYSVIAEKEWSALIRDAGVSDAYLRRVLRESGIAMSVLVEGVRQANLLELERTLLALESEYQHADRERKLACRRQVIAAKDRARLVARSEKTSKDKKSLKEEMILWMRIWLENPGAFPQWLELRKRVMPGPPGSGVSEDY